MGVHKRKYRPYSDWEAASDDGGKLISENKLQRKELIVLHKNDFEKLDEENARGWKVRRQQFKDEETKVTTGESKTFGPHTSASFVELESEALKLRINKNKGVPRSDLTKSKKKKYKRASIGMSGITKKATEERPLIPELEIVHNVAKANVTGVANKKKDTSHVCELFIGKTKAWMDALDEKYLKSNWAEAIKVDLAIKKLTYKYFRKVNKNVTHQKNFFMYIGERYFLREVFKGNQIPEELRPTMGPSWLSIPIELLGGELSMLL